MGAKEDAKAVGGLGTDEDEERQAGKGLYHILKDLVDILGKNGRKDDGQRNTGANNRECNKCKKTGHVAKNAKVEEGNAITAVKECT